MAIEIRDPCSRMAVRITMLREQPNASPLRGATATASYWKEGNIWYLVTNWHNITGCNPLTEQSMSKTGILPTHVEISLIIEGPETEAEILSGISSKAWQRYSVPLYRDGHPTWYEHPLHGHKVDVIALPVLDESTQAVKLYTLPLNEHKGWFDLVLRPGNDAFVLGYPLNIDGGRQFPLWKRASIASEPTIDYDDLPKLLIDTASRKGMSGAPVIAVSNGWNVPKGGEFGDAIIGKVEQFLGIYSGRVDDDPLGAQIGIVWKAINVKEIVEGKVVGFNPLNP